MSEDICERIDTILSELVSTENDICFNQDTAFATQLCYIGTLADAIKDLASAKKDICQAKYYETHSDEVKK